MRCDLDDPAARRGAHARPVLKWAGGKRQLLPALRQHVPTTFGAYHEPFLGSAAFFFDLWSAGRIRQARLTDTNALLVGCYDAVRRDVDAVVEHLRQLERGHLADGTAHYYAARARFNEAAAGWRASGESVGAYDPMLAALFIYLNRTGFNGLFRLNASGLFNVPAGRYRRPRICDAEALVRVARAFDTEGITLVHGPWAAILDEAAPGDFIYFDPPYAPMSSTARFTHYTAGGFDDDQQRRLAAAAIALAARGCHVLLSNSTAPLVLDLYERDPAAAAAGLRVRRVPARRAINARADRRGDVLEVLVTNVTPGETP